MSGRRSISSQSSRIITVTSRLTAAVRKLIGDHLPGTSVCRAAGGLVARVEGGSHENKAEGFVAGRFRSAIVQFYGPARTSSGIPFGRR